MRERPVTVELVLEGDRFTPGDSICGHVRPLPQVCGVDLVRVESSPTATLEFTVASVPPQSDGAFVLGVPDDAPPSISGRACALVWRVRARTGRYPQPGDARRTLELTCPS
jgi:hypothetical protein